MRSHDSFIAAFDFSYVLVDFAFMGLPMPPRLFLFFRCLAAVFDVVFMVSSSASVAFPWYIIFAYLRFSSYCVICFPYV